MKTLEMLSKLGKVEIKALHVHNQFTVELYAVGNYWQGTGTNIDEAAEEVISAFRKDNENQLLFSVLKLLQQSVNLNDTLRRFSFLGEVGIRRGEDAPIVVTLSNCGAWEDELEDFQFAADTVHGAVELMQAALREKIHSQTRIGRLYRAMEEEK